MTESEESLNEIFGEDTGEDVETMDKMIAFVEGVGGTLSTPVSHTTLMLLTQDSCFS